MISRADVAHQRAATYSSENLAFLTYRRMIHPRRRYFQEISPTTRGMLPTPINAPNRHVTRFSSFSAGEFGTVSKQIKGLLAPRE